MPNKKDKAIQDVQKLIDARAQKIRLLRNKSSKENTYVEIVLNALNELDLLCANASTTNPKNKTLIVGFWVELQTIEEKLNAKMKFYDSHVSIMINWNDTKIWTEMRALGITLQWSTYYQKLYPDKDEIEYIDSSRLLLDDIDE